MEKRRKPSTVGVTGVSSEEFAARRARVLRELGTSVGIVLAGESGAHLTGAWKPDRNFYYLTGIADEPGASVLFDPTAEDPKKRAVLFLRPLNPEIEAWEGYRDPINSALKSRTGFATVMRTSAMARMLTGAVRRSKRFACLHPFGVFDGPVSADLVLGRKVAERVPGVSFDDRTNLLPTMRAIKSNGELVLMERAVAATAAGYHAVLRSLKPGLNERDVQDTLEKAFLGAGGEGTGYGSIVGSGVRATVLHYRANNAPIEPGELLVIDAGAEVGGYTADVTRTLPVSGAFSKDQRDLYETVLRAQQAAMDAVRPGVTMTEVDGAARSVLERAGHADAFPHGIGHQLGLEVHDSTPDGPLAEGMVITIEPGVYYKDRGIGIRIEDDVLVTRKGAQNLTSMIPKSVREIEIAMRR